MTSYLDEMQLQVICGYLSLSCHSRSSSVAAIFHTGINDVIPGRQIKLSVFANIAKYVFNSSRNRRRLGLVFALLWQLLLLLFLWSVDIRSDTAINHCTILSDRQVPDSTWPEVQ